jgi:hypothetical protein
LMCCHNLDRFGRGVIADGDLDLLSDLGGGLSSVA